MSQMRVIEAASFGAPAVLQLKEVPSPVPGRDSLLIDVKAAGVNYMDLVVRAGLRPGVSPPFRPGFEIAGVVREVGSGSGPGSLAMRLRPSLAAVGTHRKSSFPQAPPCPSPRASTPP